MKKLIPIFKAVLLLALGVLAVKMMYGSPIQEPTSSIFAQVINYAECPTDKYARPFFKIKGSDTRFHVVKAFIYRMGCSDKQESSLIGKSVSFVYFNDSPTSAKVIQLSVDGHQVYSQNEFVGQSTAMGALLFMAVIAFAVWGFLSAKMHNKQQ